MNGICMACNAKVSLVWIQCPACKTMGSVFPVQELTKQSSGTNIPIESQKPPFKSEPYAGYIECLKERIVELEALVDKLKSCNNCNVFITGAWRDNPKCLKCYTGNRINWEEIHDRT